MNDHWGWEIVRLALAGAFGGAVRWMTLRDSWVEGVISITLGMICAVYLNPLVLPIITPAIAGLVVEETSRASLSAFMIGVGGITVSGFVIDLWNIRRRVLEDKLKEPKND